MQITLTEHDLEQAIRLYIANSGVVRSVATLDFARKMRGEDAGITVNLTLTDENITAQGLKDLAMAVSKARGINATPSLAAEPVQAAPEPTAPEPKEPEPTAPVVDLGEDEDEQIPFAEEAIPVEVPPESPFAEVEAVEESSPFADMDTGEAVSAEPVAAAEPAVDYAPEAIDNPFGSMDTLPVEEPTPTDAKSNEQLAANLFG